MPVMEKSNHTEGNQKIIGCYIQICTYVQMRINRPPPLKKNEYLYRIYVTREHQDYQFP